MKPIKITIITPSGTASYIWDVGFSSVYLDLGENGKRPEFKYKIQIDGRVFLCDNETDEVIKELK